MSSAKARTFAVRMVVRCFCEVVFLAADCRSSLGQPKNGSGLWFGVA